MNEHEATHGGDATRREIDRELDLVMGAVRLVRTGVASRVTVGNLPLADAIIATARVAGARLGARVETIPAGAERSFAIRVEAGVG
jgi:hypothetical protein